MNSTFTQNSHSHTFYSKIVELEEELRVVGNNLKTLEVSEEKVNLDPNASNVNETYEPNEL